MPIQIQSPGWKVTRVAASQARAQRRGGASKAAPDLPGLPPEFLTAGSSVSEEAILEPAATRTRAAAAGAVDLTCDVQPGHTAILAIRHQSGALTFHPPVQSVSRTARGPSQIQFRVQLNQPATRGLIGNAIKAIVIKVAKMGVDKGVSVLLPRLAEAVEKAAWKKRGLAEGWQRVSQEALAAGKLEPGVPVSPARSLLFIHGTFSDAARAFSGLVKTGFFERVKGAYGDRIFAFNHFSVSRTPEQNARLLLEGLPEQATVFDVVTHSRGGLVLRTLIESAAQFGELGRRFTPGRVVLVASPNEGTPLATPKRLDDTIGLIANLLEIFPDNPFTTGTSFVANGLVWLANHVTGDLPGLRAMDADGETIATIQGAPAPPGRRYSALVSNYHPSGAVLHRLLDAGIDQFFGTANDLVVPTEGGWRVDRPPTGLIPASQIGCFGPAGNLGPDAVTHLHFFTHAATADFLVNALLGRPHALNGVDPRKNLPDRRFLRGGTDAPAARIAQAMTVDESARESGATVEADEPALRINVTNGDLTFESEPLLVGHYHALQLTGTEKVMDRLIGGAMTESLEMGVYPVETGSHQIFINSRPNLERGSFMPRPAAVIVVGLGEEGKLRPANLAQSVRQAVIAWAQRIAESHKRPREIELAATLLGSGGAGISPADAARLVAQGVYDANALLRNNADSDRPVQRVSRLQFVELYLDRATEAWRALRMQEAATPGRYLIDDAVTAGTGPLDRPPDSGYRGTAFDFISVEAKNDTDGTPMVSYTLDTKRARSEVRGQRAQSKLVEELVATASNDQNRDEQIGRTLFNLLVPVELEPYLAGSGEIQIELDPQTARIPWELLTTNSESSDELPWAIRVKLIRKLRIREFRQRVSDAAADASVLVIGEPACPVEYSRLPGARSEAIAVRTCLTGDAGLAVADLISDDPSTPGATAREVVNKLFERPWRIIHIAGHGVPGAKGAPGGVVLSNGTFLGPEEFRNMRTVPELVFVNCCHLGAADAAQLLNTRYDRAEFASGVAGALIAIGVRCVIAAGWAVDDDAAIVFAEEFYQSLLRGNRFIVAVGEARAAARARSPHLNTWAAYQCYGDADWVLTARPPDPNQAQAPRTEDYTGIGSASALRLALRRITVRTKFQGVDVAEQLRNLEELEKLFAGRWGGQGDVAELFGEALVEAGDLEAGMTWYERAVLASDATASIKAAEQLANVRGRVAWEIVDTAVRDLDARKKAERAGGRTPKARAAARRARLEAERSLKRAITRADDLIKRSLDLLARMVAVESTMERTSLIGSAYKRQALVDAAAGRRAGMQKALRQMRDAYSEAQTLGEKRGATDLYYPISNRLTAEVALHAAAGQWRRFDRQTAANLRRALAAKSETDPDFWSVVGEAELDQHEAMAARKLARARPQLVRAYEDLHTRVAASRMWATVYDTASLLLPAYASHSSAAEREAATELLVLLRSFAHPDEVS